MAIVSSHTLNSVDGTQAGGIPVSLRAVGSDRILFNTNMDDNGQLQEVVDLSGLPADERYEMVFDTAGYWASLLPGRHRPQIMTDIVVRFLMPDPDERYHIPIIMSPNGHSMWWSN